MCVCVCVCVVFHFTETPLSNIHKKVLFKSNRDCELFSYQISNSFLLGIVIFIEQNQKLTAKSNKSLKEKIVKIWVKI